MSAAAQLAETLGGRSSGGGWTAKCPAHDDRNPSLSISDGRNGRPLVHCHAGCEPSAVIEALRARGLWPDAHAEGGEIPTAHFQLGAYSQSWDYQDAAGRHVMRVCRWDTPDAKQIRPLTLQSGRWTWKHFDADRPLYRLAALLREPSKRVLLVEGEKTAEAAHKYFGGNGMIATTWSGGAKAARKTDWSPLAHRDVTLVPDNDAAGRDAMNDIGVILQAQGCTVRLADLSAMNLRERWDIADALDDRDVDLDALWNAIHNASACKSNLPTAVRTALKPPESKTLASTADTKYNTAEQAQHACDLAAALVRLRGRDIKPKRLEPIWPGVLYKGKVMILAGLPGDGKSALTCDIVARITRGDVWPCSALRAQSGYGVLLTAEDDPEDTIRPRMDVAGADPDRYEIITGVHRNDEQMGEHTLCAVSLIEDLPRIEAVILLTKATALIVDPLTSFATTDTNKTGDMRRLLDKLADLARRTGCCIVIVTHLNKRADAKKAMHMIAGSHVIVAAVRTAFATARDPNDPKRRLMLPLKLNIAKEDGGFAFRMDDAHHDICGSTPRVVWESERVNDVSADDALIDQTPRAQASVEKSAEVQAWLTDLLRHGPMEARSMWRQAEERGYAERRVRGALKALKAVCENKGYQGNWHYWLPQSPAEKDVP